MSTITHKKHEKKEMMVTKKHKHKKIITDEQEKINYAKMSFDELLQIIEKEVALIDPPNDKILPHLKNLQKIYKKKMKPTEKISHFNEKYKIPKELSIFLHLTDDNYMTRSEITKLIYDYIKKHDLVDKNDPRQIIANKKIMKLFGLNSKYELKFTNFQTHLNKFY